jgi:hypothetical protein
MEPVIFRYRCRELTSKDIEFIRSKISEYYSRGRAYISKILCSEWNWVQPNGKLKEYAARDLLLRLEEGGFIELPPRLRPNNNLRHKSFRQIPLYKREHLVGAINDYSDLTMRLIDKGDTYLWSYLLHHYHYLGVPLLVGEHLRYVACINGQVVACLAWASAAWRVRSRDEFIQWEESTKRKRLSFIANNTRYLILPWIQIKHLASKVLALNLKRLSDDWLSVYNHRVYLAETFVDQSRFKGICYKASNWQYVGQTSGSAKKGNEYRYHGQQKAVYLYPLHRNFRRLLNDEKG